MDPKSIADQNTFLEQTSKLLFADSAVFKIVEPGSLLLLKENARYFKKDTYKQLVDNIKKDKRLSSVPLCHATETGQCEVLSGNHRVKAAVEARVPHIMIILLLEPLSQSHKIAIQLSHNALVGLDDPHILAKLWAGIDEIKEKLYAGLSSETAQELEQIQLVTFSTPQVYTKSVTFAFTAAEKEDLEHVLAELEGHNAQAMYLAHINDFKPFFDALQAIKGLHKIKNGSIAMLKLIEIAKDHIKGASDNGLRGSGCGSS